MATFGNFRNLHKSPEAIFPAYLPPHYTCVQTKALDKNLVCNGIVDCPSGDDELNCGKPSLTNIFKAG